MGEDRSAVRLQSEGFEDEPRCLPNALHYTAAEAESHSGALLKACLWQIIALLLKLNHFALQYRFILCITIIIIIPTLRIDFCPVDKTIENSIIPGHRFVEKASE